MFFDILVDVCVLSQKILLNLWIQALEARTVMVSFWMDQCFIQGESPGCLVRACFVVAAKFVCFYCLFFCVIRHVHVATHSSLLYPCRNNTPFTETLS